MKKIFFILFTLVAFIGYGQSVLTDVNGKVITSATGDILVQEEDPNNFEYTPNAEWIPVNGVADNEIWILAFDGTGDRYSSFVCTVANSGTYNMQIYGGADGKTLLSTYGATASGTQMNFQIPSGTGKYCSTEGYYTYKIRIYATISTNNITSFYVTKHPSTTITNQNWKIINFGTKSIQNISSALLDGNYIPSSITSFCPYLLYANTYYCININGKFDFLYAQSLQQITMPKTMDYITELSTPPYSGFGICFGSFAHDISLKYISMPTSMNSLQYIGTKTGITFGTQSSAAFNGCISLPAIKLPDKLPNLIKYGSLLTNATVQGAFNGCTNLKNIYGAKEMPLLNNMTGTSANTALIYIDQCVKYSSNSIPFSSTGLKNMVTFQQDSLKASSFTLTGTSAGNRSNITSILINWSKSNFTGNIDLRYNSLSNTEIDRIFTALPTTVLGLTINVASNIGAATCTPSIATAKGWIVVTS